MKTKGVRKLEVWNYIAFAILGLYLLFLVFPLFRVLSTSVIGENRSIQLKIFQ